VTGNSELNFVSESSEISIGKKQYLPSRQSSGGDYVVDTDLSAYVASVGRKLAAVSDRKLPYEFVVINESMPNAWALPGGKIAINRGLLLELKNEAELAAVLGHEIVHAAARHGAQSMQRGVLLQGAILATGIALKDKDYGRLATDAAGLGAGLLSKKYSRSAELESDHYGILYMHRAGYDPRAAVSLQETFVRLSKAKKSHWLEGLFASHPPSQERVEKNRAFVNSLALEKLILGKKAYLKATARLRKSKRAYDAYDEGVKAVKERQSARVMSLAKKALAIEPKEALFHSLKGDAFTLKKHHKSAERAYSKAIQLNGAFYRFYLERGLARKALGRTAGAKQDFVKSNQFLATEIAHYNLGLIAQNSGQKSQAMRHFKHVKSSRSQLASKARKSLAKLEMSGNVARHLQSRLDLSRSGELLVELTNLSPLALSQIEFVVGVKGGRKLSQQRRFQYKQVIPTGRKIVLKTGIRLHHINELRQWAVFVESARISRP